MLVVLLLSVVNRLVLILLLLVDMLPKTYQHTGLLRKLLLVFIKLTVINSKLIKARAAPEYGLIHYYYYYYDYYYYY